MGYRGYREGRKKMNDTYSVVFFENKQNLDKGFLIAIINTKRKMEGGGLEKDSFQDF